MESGQRSGFPDGTLPKKKPGDFPGGAHRLGETVRERERNGLIIRTVLSASPFERDGGPDRRLDRSKANSAEYEALETLSSCS